MRFFFYNILTVLGTVSNTYKLKWPGYELVQRCLISTIMTSPAHVTCQLSVSSTGGDLTGDAMPGPPSGGAGSRDGAIHATFLLRDSFPLAASVPAGDCDLHLDPGADLLQVSPLCAAPAEGGAQDPCGREGWGWEGKEGGEGGGCGSEGEERKMMREGESVLKGIEERNR